MVEQLAQAKREHRLQQAGRWAIRLSIAATVITENPKALTAAIAGGKQVEKRLQSQRKMRKEEIVATIVAYK
jgi:hypothetical protein